MRSQTTTYAWVLLKHHLVHDLFQSLDDSEASLAGQFEESKIFFEQPRSIWREENVGLRTRGLFQGQFHRLDELCVLGMIEEKVCQDKHIKDCICGQMTRYSFRRCTP